MGLSPSTLSTGRGARTRRMKRQVSTPTAAFGTGTDDAEHKLKYFLPKSVEDIDRMSIPHYLYQLIWQSSFTSPIKDRLRSGCHVLDVGCGSGTWVIDCADMYRMSEFVGVDLECLFAGSPSRRNVKFVQANVLDRLPFDDDSFDFVRMSLFVTTLAQHEWLFALKEMTRVLKPSGYLELQEPSYGLYNRGPACDRLVTSLLELLSLRGINGEIVNKLELLLAATEGLTDISHTIRKVPIGQFGGKTGMLLKDTLAVYFNDVYNVMLAEHMGIEPEEYDNLWQKCEEEFARCGTYCNVYRFWTQKQSNYS